MLSQRHEEENTDSGYGSEAEDFDDGLPYFPTVTDELSMFDYFLKGGFTEGEVKGCELYRENGIYGLLMVGEEDWEDKYIGLEGWKAGYPW